MSIPKNSKQDWDTLTGWEKRIKVDFGSIGPNHVRWSHWTYKERDIVARKVHEISTINELHGNKSKTADEWRKENAPIMVDFARDGKPMPDWAHAGYRDSGVPTHVDVIWKRENPDDPASKGDWAYDKDYPWGEGEEPAWSSKPKDPEYTGHMDKKYGGVISYTTRKNGDHVDQNGNVISTKESRAKEDIPHWRKFEVARLEDVDGHTVPGPNALPKDFEQYGENIVKTKRDPLEDANRYRKAVGLPPLEDSQSDKLRAALLKVNARADVVVKEFNAETGTLDEIQGSAITMTTTENHARRSARFTPLRKGVKLGKRNTSRQGAPKSGGIEWQPQWVLTMAVIRTPLMRSKRFGSSSERTPAGQLRLTGLIVVMRMSGAWLSTIFHLRCRGITVLLILKNCGIKSL